MRSSKIKKLCSFSLWTCLHHMVILRSQNKITDFLMILAWASPFNIACVGGVTASMVAFQAIDPGSTPGRRKLFYMTS